MEILFEMVLCALGGFVAIFVNSRLDNWLKYSDKAEKTAYTTVFSKASRIEQKYRNIGNESAVNDCIELQNLLICFKEDLSDKTFKWNIWSNFFVKRKMKYGC